MADEPVYTYTSIHFVDVDGNSTNDKVFLGRMPKEGQAVEMVFVGTADDGAMRFNLRTKGGKPEKPEKKKKPAKPAKPEVKAKKRKR